MVGVQVAWKSDPSTTRFGLLTGLDNGTKARAMKACLDTNVFNIRLTRINWNHRLLYNSHRKGKWRFSIVEIGVLCGSLLVILLLMKGESECLVLPASGRCASPPPSCGSGLHSGCTAWTVFWPESMWWHFNCRLDIRIIDCSLNECGNPTLWDSWG